MYNVVYLVLVCVMCLAACSVDSWTGCCMGSQAERQLMKALAGCSNKEQIIISGHCPPPSSLPQHHPHPHLLTLLLRTFIGPVAGMRKRGVPGLKLFIETSTEPGDVRRKKQQQHKKRNLERENSQ